MEFAYFRAGRGHPSSGTDTSGLDTWWSTYVPAAKAAGLAVGGYWRFYPSVDPGRQVLAFTDRLNAAPLDLPPMVDIEDADGLSQTALTDWAVQALTGVQARVGVAPVWYTNRSFLADNLDAARLAQWRLALAAWSGVATDWPDERAEFWQWAGDVVVPWAAGRVDLQRWRT